jgi:hypothetical protein
LGEWLKLKKLRLNDEIAECQHKEKGGVHGQNHCEIEWQK